MCFIKNLTDLPINDIVDCILVCFDDYFVKFPSDIDYWAERFRKDNVDWSLSFGMFNELKLVGFILTGVGVHQSHLTAFNTGTGVIPSFRGRRVVDRLYFHALPIFKQHNITACALEVIQKNKKAVHVYERIGFGCTRMLKCFKGRLPLDAHMQCVSTTLVEQSEEQKYYSYADYNAWGNSANALVNSTEGVFRTYLVLVAEGGISRNIGYFVMQPLTLYVAQLAVFSSEEPAAGALSEEMKLWKFLFQSMATVCSSSVLPVNLVNVDTSRTNLVTYLQQLGLDNSIDQHEMQMII